jgi:hypothetical protein
VKSYTGRSAAEEGDNHCHVLYHFWGVDFMASMDNSVQLLEMNGANAWCNLQHLMQVWFGPIESPELRGNPKQS